MLYRETHERFRIIYLYKIALLDVSVIIGKFLPAIQISVKQHNNDPTSYSIVLLIIYACCFVSMQMRQRTRALMKALLIHNQKLHTISSPFRLIQYS